MRGGPPYDMRVERPDRSTGPPYDMRFERPVRSTGQTRDEQIRLRVLEDLISNTHAKKIKTAIYINDT